MQTSGDATAAPYLPVDAVLLALAQLHQLQHGVVVPQDAGAVGAPVVRLDIGPGVVIVGCSKRW